MEVFVVFFVCHLTGDFLLQTEWQAANKRGGIGPDPRARNALLSHIATYTLAFVPAFVWLADSGAGPALGALALVSLPHLVQDDGRLLDLYMRAVKRTRPDGHQGLVVAVDQSFHFVVLFATALIVGT